MRSLFSTKDPEALAEEDQDQTLVASEHRSIHEEEKPAPKSNSRRVSFLHEVQQRDSAELSPQLSIHDDQDADSAMFDPNIDPEHDIIGKKFG
jgi:hypothetical protein